MSDLTPEQMTEFLQRPLVAVFVTLRADGSPHAIPIWYEYRDGDFLVFTSSRSQRARNLERNSRAAITISTHDEPYVYVSAEGPVAITSEGVEETGLSIAQRYMGNRGRQFLDDVYDEHSVILRLTPERILTWAED
ncbi:MAG: PPOX class F420-dependent oxidoreductase [Chloroflexota bacterium]|nr:PPOX class F420-dependent oxidoreductase [Chloroflexota bacterium]MDE2885099.1 PPOX class F420-dependent oxidoreductase [Chloroflexota bacterium]